MGDTGKVFYKTTNRDRYDMLKHSARYQRAFPTIAEDVLWKELKGKKLGYRFRRQHAILDYIVDFICLDTKLIIEVDGGYHQDPLQVEDDEARTSRIIDAGFRVIRFTNEQVLYDIDQVILTIKKELTN